MTTAEAVPTLGRPVAITCGDHLDLCTNPGPVSRHKGGRGFWVVAATFAVVQFGGAIPIPLYGLWRKQFPFGNGTLTTIFAVYVLGVLAALLLLAPLSDQLGRRPLLMVALLCVAVGTILFLVADDVGLLMVARFVSGLAAGITTATATASMHELVPEERAKTASLTSTAMNTGGLGAGTLFAGIVAAYAPDPTKLVFWVYLVLVALCLAGMFSVTETVVRPKRVSLRPRGFKIPSRRRGTFWLACGAAAVVFSQLGLYSSLVPSFVSMSVHEHNLAVAGSISAGIFLIATITQLIFHRVSPVRAMKIGLLILLLGLGLIELALWSGVLGTLLAGTLLGGLAVGFAFMGAVAVANLLATPDRRGQVLATFFCFAYIGLSCPSLGVGFATDSVSVTSATLVCTIVIAAIAVMLEAILVFGRIRIEKTDVPAVSDG